MNDTAPTCPPRSPCRRALRRCRVNTARSNRVRTSESSPTSLEQHPPHPVRKGQCPLMVGHVRHHVRQEPPPASTPHAGEHVEVEHPPQRFRPVHSRPPLLHRLLRGRCFKRHARFLRTDAPGSALPSPEGTPSSESPCRPSSHLRGGGEVPTPTGALHTPCVGPDARGGESRRGGHDNTAANRHPPRKGDGSTASFIPGSSHYRGRGANEVQLAGEPRSPRGTARGSKARAKNVNGDAVTDGRPVRGAEQRRGTGCVHARRGPHIHGQDPDWRVGVEQLAPLRNVPARRVPGHASCPGPAEVRGALGALERSLPERRQ